MYGWTFQNIKNLDRIFIIYPSVLSSIGTVFHNDKLPVSTPLLSAEAAACPSDVDSSDKVGTSWRAWRTLSSGHSSNGKEIPRQVERRYDGWLHLLFDTWWRNLYKRKKTFQCSLLTFIKIITLSVCIYPYLWHIAQRFMRYIV